MILEPETVSRKHFKIQEINIVWWNFCAQHIREAAYLSRDPQWGVHPHRFPSPPDKKKKKGSDQLAKLPATEGIPLRDVCFFCSTEGNEGEEKKQDLGG